MSSLHLIAHWQEKLVMQDKIDRINTEILKDQIALEDLEIDHQKKLKALEEEYNLLEEDFYRIRTIFEQSAEAAHYDADYFNNPDGLATFYKALGDFSEAAETKFFEDRNQLTQKEEAILTDFSRKKGLLEEELNQKYYQRKRYFEEAES